MTGRGINFDTSWARRPAAQAVREVVLYLLGVPIDYYTQPTVLGLELFDGLKPPVVFAANHSSHLDTPLILRALPTRWRRRTAVVAAADYFYRNQIIAGLVTLAFGTVPIERKGGLSQATTQRIDRLLDERWNLLLYPEGTRSRSGEMGRLRPGASFFAVEYGVPLVPIHVGGTHAAMPVGRPWPTKHPVTVSFGAALYPAPGENHKSLTARLAESLRRMRPEEER